MAEITEDLRSFEQNFKVDLLLGHGSFGKVVRALHLATNIYVAVKLAKDDTLQHEHEIYELLSIHDTGFNGSVKPIPTIYGFGKIGELKWLAMDLLGQSIDQLLEQCGGHFSIKTILMLGVQMIDCLNYLHRRNIIHGDIKGDNFAVSATDPHRIKIFDFGLAHDASWPVGQFRGSLLYASIETHRWAPVRPKDDTESLGYLLADFHQDLPWKFIDWPSTFHEQIEFGLKQKLRKNIFAMSRGFFELTLFLMHVDAKDKPSHAYLRGMLR